MEPAESVLDLDDVHHTSVLLADSDAVAAAVVEQEPRLWKNWLAPAVVVR